MQETQESFEAHTEWAANQVMEMFDGDGKRAIAALVVTLSELNVEVIRSLKIAGEYCEAQNKIPFMPITEDVKTTSDRMVVTLAIISTLMLRNVLDIDMQGASHDLSDILKTSRSKMN